MKRSISKKLLRSIAVLFISLYLIVCVFASFAFRQALTEQARTDNEIVLDQAIQQISSMMSLVAATAQQIITDESIFAGIARVNAADYPAIETVHVNTMLQRYSSLNPYTSGVSIFSGDRLFYSRGIAPSQLVKPLYNTKWFSDFRASDNRMMISPTHKHWLDNAYKDCISLVMKFKNLTSQSSLEQYLLLDIPLYTIEDILDDSLLVMDSHGTIIASSNLVSAEDTLRAQRHADSREHYNSQKNNSPQMLSLKDFTVFKSEISEYGWQFYLPIATTEFNQKTYGMLTLLILAFAGSLIIVLIILSKIISRITKPVYTLKTAMEDTYEGNLDVRADIKSGDEFEFLADCFNELVTQLKQHIQKIIDDEEIRKQMQADLMLSQIHPHFVYNTLNAAIYMIEEDNSNDATEILYSLIAILQNVVKLGNHQIFTTIRDELKLLDAYINIEKIRYPDRFSLTVNCQDILLDEAIPQVVIQPLVENALFHGILPTNYKGEISVDIYREASHMIIIIKDNGIGFPMQDIEKLTSQTTLSVHGIGLSNIKNRITFLYNALSYDFTVTSTPSIGTSIRISLPLDKINPDSP